MVEYKISIDKKIIAILGPHLYGDTASILAELISNSHDADARDCWVTLKTGVTPEVIIEDNGHGMTPKEVNKYFLDIGYDRRDERPTTPGGRDVFGRKGIGKLAAFSLAKKIELYSLKDGLKAGCILDYDKITKENKDPDPIPDKDIVFDSEKLSENGTGTRLVLKEIQKNINTTYYYLVNKIVRNFNLGSDEFKIHIAKNYESPRVIDYATLNFFDKMDTIITIGDEYREKGNEVKTNSISAKYKAVLCYDDDTVDKKKLHVQIPRSIEVLGKNGEKKQTDFTFKGWIGTIVDKGQLKSLIQKDGASDEEEKSISINDNRITIFSRKRIGEYDVLPKVQTDTIYDAYVIGEIHADILEDNRFVDMAISNRRGYEETDERYRALIKNLKSLASYIAQRKADVNKKRKEDKEKEEADDITKNFLSKTQTMNILKSKLDESERKVVEAENFQFLRAAKLTRNTKRVLISHNSENKDYGFFIMKMFELLGVDIQTIFIFTSYELTGVPHGENIYDYLKGAFREDLYIIFLFSKHFYDSNMSIAETGASWATNKEYSPIVIDIDFADVDKPIDNSTYGLVLGDLNHLDKDGTKKFVKAVYGSICLPVPDDAKILEAIEKAVAEFSGKLNANSFYPKRKYQGHPICDSATCGNSMVLKIDPAGVLYYECQTPGCGNRINARI